MTEQLGTKQEAINKRPWPDCLEKVPMEPWVVSNKYRSNAVPVVYETEAQWLSWLRHVDAYWPDHEKVPWPVSEAETK